MDAPPPQLDPDQLVMFDLGDLVAELTQAIKDIGGQIR